MLVDADTIEGTPHHMSLPPTSRFDHGDDTEPFEPPPKRSSNTGAWIILGSAVALLIVVIGVVVGTGGSDEPAAAPAVTQTITVSQTVAPGPRPTPSSTTPSVTSTAATPAGEGLMPQVVCMNLQAAQDLIQRSGVFYSRSRDATGKGRQQIFDRNWIVVSQSPAAGERIGEGDAVLSVVKTDEPNPC